jgi:hypothetical protein
MVEAETVRQIRSLDSLVLERDRERKTGSIPRSTRSVALGA